MDRVFARYGSFLAHFARFFGFARYSARVLAGWCPGGGEIGGAGIGNKNKQLFFCCPGWPGCPGEIQPFAHARAHVMGLILHFTFLKTTWTPRADKIKSISCTWVWRLDVPGHPGQQVF
jgi:hypothetical protein